MIQSLSLYGTLFFFSGHFNADYKTIYVQEEKKKQGMSEMKMRRKIAIGNKHLTIYFNYIFFTVGSVALHMSHCSTHSETNAKKNERHKRVKTTTNRIRSSQLENCNFNIH